VIASRHSPRSSWKLIDTVLDMRLHSRPDLNNYGRYPTAMEIFVEAEAMSRFSCLKIEVSPVVPEGSIALWKDGGVVYIGKLGDPIEDAECDTVMLHPADYERLSKTEK
jgi:hypothetical protein